MQQPPAEAIAGCAASLTGYGKTSISVTDNVTSSEIYASAKVNSYTYNIVYVSSNGTELGSTSATYNYGTTNTISAPAKSGYTTPSSQSVAWDSTEAKTITFTYAPVAVTNSAKAGSFLSSSPKITYSATMNYRNRTATSVQVQLTTTVTMQTGWSGFAHGIAYKATCGSASSGVVQVAGYKDLTASGSSRTESSGWITIPLNTTDATTISFSVYMYQSNYYNNDLTSYGYASNSVTWTMSIPAY